MRCRCSVALCTQGEQLLRELLDASASLWNELNYERRQQSGTALRTAGRPSPPGVGLDRSRRWVRVGSSPRSAAAGRPLAGSEERLGTPTVASLRPASSRDSVPPDAARAPGHHGPVALVSRRRAADAQRTSTDHPRSRRARRVPITAGGAYGSVVSRTGKKRLALDSSSTRGPPGQSSRRWLLPCATTGRPRSIAATDPVGSAPRATRSGRTARSSRTRSR